MIVVSECPGQSLFAVNSSQLCHIGMSPASEGFLGATSKSNYDKFLGLGYFRSSKPILPSPVAAKFMVFAATIYCEAPGFHGYCETGERRMRIG